MNIQATKTRNAWVLKLLNRMSGRLNREGRHNLGRLAKMAGEHPLIKETTFKKRILEKIVNFRCKILQK